MLNSVPVFELYLIKTDDHRNVLYLYYLNVIENWDFNLDFNS